MMLLWDDHGRDGVRLQHITMQGRPRWCFYSSPLALGFLCGVDSAGDGSSSRENRLMMRKRTYRFKVPQKGTWMSWSSSIVSGSEMERGERPRSMRGRRFLMWVRLMKISTCQWWLGCQLVFPVWSSCEGVIQLQKDTGTLTMQRNWILFNYLTFEFHR